MTKELAYYAQSGTVERRTVCEKPGEYIALQVEYCPRKDCDKKEVSPIFLFSDKSARLIGWYFLRQSFINSIRKKLSKRGA